jgi:hypothetical protein
VRESVKPLPTLFLAHFHLTGCGKLIYLKGTAFRPYITYFAMNAALQAAEKPKFFEGDGLQAVRKRLKTDPALAAEGTTFAAYSTFFPQPV